MKLQDVLVGKSIDGVFTVSERETLSGLTKTLGEKRIGAAVVSSTGRDILGVISERDVITAICAGGPNCLNDPIERHMTVEVQTADPSETVERALDRMTTGRFRHMPVVEGGALIGVVSIGDLVKAQIDALKAENAALEEFIRS
ncbi:MAG: CBS domain-containing protein [Pseudomonadota bacterium]